MKSEDGFMYLDLEKKFVNEFINPLYRDRLMFEFKTSKKRLNAIMRFCHNTNDLVKKDMIYSKLKKFDDNELKKFLKDQYYYVVSFKYIDGTLMNIIEILDYINDEHMPVIVYGDNIAVIKREYEKGEDNFYLLKK